MPMHAGAAVVDITPGAGVAMGGYGARRGVSHGTHDVLAARTLVLDDGSSKAVVSICDLVGVGPDILNEARQLIADELEIAQDAVIIGATHTHSGPGNIRAKDSSGYASFVARKIAGSVHEALHGLEPVGLKLGTTHVDQISQNRRHPDGPIETNAKVLLAAGEAGHAPVATVVGYACHSTVLEYDNMLYSGDFPAAMCRFVERNLGGTAIYVQGCAGDINPIWMRHDFAEVERIGGILGAAATRVGHELRPVGEGQWAVNLSWSESTPKEPAPGLVLQNPGIEVCRTLLDMPRRVLPPQEQLDAEIGRLEAQLKGLDAGDVEGRRAVRPLLNRLRMERVRGLGAKHPGQTETVEVTAIRISDDCAIVTLPGEMVVEIGRDIEARAGGVNVIVAGYSNGYIGYVPKASDFPEHGYEVGCARFDEVAADMLTDAAVEALATVTGKRLTGSPA